MTKDTSKPEGLTDDALDNVQGGFGSWGEPTSTFDTPKGNSRPKVGPKRYIGETEKNIVAQSGNGKI